jgi:hypothetical protein
MLRSRLNFICRMVPSLFPPLSVAFLKLCFRDRDNVFCCLLESFELLFSRFALFRFHESNIIRQITLVKSADYAVCHVPVGLGFSPSFSDCPISFEYRIPLPTTPRKALMNRPASFSLRSLNRNACSSRYRNR